MSVTPRLGLETLSSGQAGKENSVNESLHRLDLLVGGLVEEPPRNSPPTSPASGQCWIVGPSPSGAWAGQAHCVAGYTVGGWRFIAPTEGLSLQVKTSGAFVNYRGGAWVEGEIRATSVNVGGQQVVGARGTAIASPSGGSVVDGEARAALTAILAALRNHGLIAT